MEKKRTTKFYILYQVDVQMSITAFGKNQEVGNVMQEPEMGPKVRTSKTALTIFIKFNA